ncbi:protelomerase family protein [Pectobacterium brasiliense]|uniref:protelomerase family protein n=1 Tax=Pectobacterium brasiliense TaxID=180957 RepID=UPI000B965617|nr:protelomerase family protein [Pectobacterium carotovorum]OYN53220.1 protelomerase [Pectobacterium carotovorum]
MSVQKIKFGELVNALVSKVNEIDASDIPQGEKTRKYKAEAKKFNNALFLDKRRYRGQGLKRRITLNTFNAYLSRARKKFDDRLHHHFHSDLERLIKRYPAYSDELREWTQLPAAEVRQRLHRLLDRLKSAMTVAEKASPIRFGTAAGNKKLESLAKQYPDWAGYLRDCKTEDYQAPQKALYASLEQGSRLLDELGSLRVNHEILYHLTLSTAERTSIQNRWDNVLSEKKRNTITIDYPTYMQRLMDILTAPVQSFHFGTRAGMAPLAFALAAVSGRRMIEIMVQGEFDPVNKYEMNFIGQAKKRTGNDTGRRIYCLCDTSVFIERLKILRESSAAADLVGLVNNVPDDETRSGNAMVNTRLSVAFNPFVKDFFSDDRRVYKDSRAIYARIVYEQFFNSDPRWKDCDEDVFFSEILGHDDENTQLHYKQFKLRNFSTEWQPSFTSDNPRLEALQALDDDMPGLANGDAAVRLHDWVKGIIANDPSAKITTYTIRKQYGGNPAFAKRYLDYVAPALGMEVGDDGRFKPAIDEEIEPVVIFEIDDDNNFEESSDDDVDDNDELELDDGDDDKDDTKQEKPRFAAPISRGENRWLIKFEFAGGHYSWEGDAENVRDAMKRAWDANI